MSASFTTAIAANRFGLGARPGELDAIGGDGRDWLKAQLVGGPPLVVSGELRPSHEILAEALRIRRETQEARRARAGDTAAAGAADQRLPQYLRPIYVAEATARLRQAVASDRAF